MYAREQTFVSAFTRKSPLLLLILFATAVAVSGTVVTNRRTQQELTREQRIEAERRLSELGYWTGPVDGNFDSSSRHALIAFQKVEGRQRTGQLNANELDVLRTAARPTPRFRDHEHVEIDIRRQVLFIVGNDGVITGIIPVCTGNEGFYTDHGQLHRAHTPRGTFKIERKIAGWRLSSLGLLYYPNYIHQGIAIHGSLAMAVYPASHGCIRIPMFAAKELSRLLPVGMEVIVYDD
jgi:hypothetical protein